MSVSEVILGKEMILKTDLEEQKKQVCHGTEEQYE